MSKGKYSPTMLGFNYNIENQFIYNCFSQIPPEFVAGRDTYNPKIHFDGYDKDGFDSYGYSAFDSNGEYVGIRSGVDRNGITENEYLVMTDEEYDTYF